MYVRMPPYPANCQWMTVDEFCAISLAGVPRKPKPHTPRERVLY